MRVQLNLHRHPEVTDAKNAARSSDSSGKLAKVVSPPSEEPHSVIEWIVETYQPYSVGENE